MAALVSSSSAVGQALNAGRFSASSRQQNVADANTRSSARLTRSGSTRCSSRSLRVLSERLQCGQDCCTTDGRSSSVAWAASPIMGSSCKAANLRRKQAHAPSRRTVVAQADRSRDPVDLPIDGLPSTAECDFTSLMSQVPVHGFAPANLAEMNPTAFALEMSMGGSAVAASVVNRPKWLKFAKSREEERQLLDRVINGALVGFAGAAAATKMFTVDHDYWSGWTVYEILRTAPLHNWRAYEEMLATNPILAKMLISGVVYTLGDWSAQCYEGRGMLGFDRGRLARSGLVGFCLHGSLSHHYYHFCEWLLPFQAWWVVPLKVAFDQTIWSALWNSIYYIALGMLRFENPINIVRELRATFLPLLTAGWKLWPFAHIVTYGVMPVEQRLLWVDMVELVWVTILSMIVNEKAEDEGDSGDLQVLAVSGVDGVTDCTLAMLEHEHTGSAE